MVEITKSFTTTHHTVKDGDRLVGAIEGSDELGWTAEYWVPVLINGKHNGQYSIKRCPWTETKRMDNLLRWLEDQDGLYRDNPRLALMLCR